MSRPPRIDYPGARHHVLNRGARRQHIFLDDDCFNGFIQILAELPARFGVRIHGYALMPNHFHLMVESVRGNLSRAMQYLQSRYSQWLNARYEWDGPLFKDRFKNKVVEDDLYWAHLLAYLHLNWVRAHLASAPDESGWTSHGAYVGLTPVPPWLEVSELQELFVTREAYVQYLEDVQRRREQPPVGFDTVLFFPSPWSDEDGEEESRDEASSDGADENNAWVPPASHLIAPDEAMIAVALVTGRPRDELMRGLPGRGRDNRVRWLAMWWLNEVTPLSQADIGRLLGASPPVVSRSISRIRLLRNTDDEIAGWAEKLGGPGGHARGSG